MTYVARHARRPSPSDLPEAMRGLADLITVIDSNEEET